MNKKHIPFLVLFFLSLQMHALSSSFELNDSFEKIRINASELEVYIGGDAEENPYEMISSASFKKGVLQDIHPGNDKVYWVKFTIKNNSDKHWLLEHLDANIGSIKYWFFNGDMALIEKGESGLFVPFENRKIKHFNLVFDLPFPKTTEGTVLLQIQSQRHFQYSFQLVQHDIFLNYSLKEYCFIGVFYGCLLLMMLYNLLIYFTTKDKLYLYYVFYVTFSGLYACGSEIGFQLLWPSFPAINKYIDLIGLILMPLCYYLYAQHFMQMNKQQRNYVKYVLVALFVQTGLEYFITNTDYFLFTIPAPFLLILFFSIKKHRNEKYQPAPFMIAGTIALISGLMVYALMGKGIIPSNIWTVYTLNLAIIIELGAFSMALGRRIQMISSEKEKASKALHEELEIKVNERTTELKKVNEEIVNLNQLLNFDIEELKIDLIEAQKARLLNEKVDFEEFTKAFPNDAECYKFLASAKWTKGYKCHKCSNDKFIVGKTEYSRKCTECDFDESAVMFTLFFNVRFQILKAFYIAYFYCESEEKIPSTEISRLLVLRQKTAWAFMQKIKTRMEEKQALHKSSRKLSWMDYIFDDAVN